MYVARITVAIETDNVDESEPGAEATGKDTRINFALQG